MLDIFLNILIIAGSIVVLSVATLFVVLIAYMLRIVFKK
jgi:hypothetical protein